MGLVLNLRKTLSNWVSKVLAESLSAFIRRRARLISKKQDNSSSTESLQNPLTQEDLPTIIATSSAGTSEKTTMKETIEPVSFSREYAINRIHYLAEGDLQSQFDAVAIAEEFDEWINLPDGPNEIDCLVIEQDMLTKEEE